MVIAVLCFVTNDCQAVDIRVVSATTTDSSSIQLDYEIASGPLSLANVPAHIYRSADPVLDPASDVLLAETTLQQIVTGEHSQEIVVPASGLAISSALPFIFVAVDLPTVEFPNGIIVESDESNNVAMFRKHTLAVIVHGLTFADIPPEWVSLMSMALTENGYDAVIPVDWAVLSHAILPGVPQEFAATLATDVLDHINEMGLGPDDRVDVHWIGHSRGAVVVSQSLLNWESASLPDTVTGGWIKLTLLDPHPAKNRSPKMMSVNNRNPLGPLLAFGTVLFQAIANDLDVILPTGLIDESELYYQRTDWFLLSPDEVYFDYLTNYWGEAPLKGIPLSKTYDITQPLLSHFEVPNFYIDEVLNNNQE